jgi:hypothetical protein
VDLQVVKTSLDTLTNSLQETLASQRKDIHEELGLIFKVEVQSAKALIEA